MYLLTRTACLRWPPFHQCVVQTHLLALARTSQIYFVTGHKQRSHRCDQQGYSSDSRSENTSSVQVEVNTPVDMAWKHEPHDHNLKEPAIDERNPPIASKRPTMKRSSNQYREWQSLEIDTLIKLRDAGVGIKAIAKTLGRSVYSTESKVRHLHKTREVRRWTAAQDRQLLDLELTGNDLKSLAAHFPSRTPQSIVQRLSKLRHRYTVSSEPKKWSVQECEALCSLRETARLSWHEIAEKLPGRGAQAVMSKYEHLKRDSEVKRASWTVLEDCQLLRLRREGVTYPEIAKQLAGRSLKAVQQRSYTLALRKSQEQARAVSSEVSVRDRDTT